MIRVLSEVDASQRAKSTGGWVIRDGAVLERVVAGRTRRVFTSSLRCLHAIRLEDHYCAEVSGLTDNSTYVSITLF